MPAAYRRVILKVSGEALSGPGGEPLSAQSADRLALEIKGAADEGAEIGVVIGGGNILRGAAAGAAGADRVSSDYAGMVATLINGIALKSALARLGVRVRHMSAIPCGRVAEAYDHSAADACLASGEIVIFTAGTGNPFFSTDTAAVLRAAELGADALLKATQADGVYDSDPASNPAAVRLASVTYQQMLEKRLAVMDMTAVSLAREQSVPLVVFALSTPGNIARAVAGEQVGTTVKGG
ncbi:MAG: UMP kinase [Candidatus Eisenbacteria bacterium]|nr:UMP kinase [Candidatus Eisenbacteria bacterium]